MDFNLSHFFNSSILQAANTNRIGASSATILTGERTRRQFEHGASDP